ncbi:CPXV013 protein [Cowpox virus]|uniref:CPXV013 protein n=1 Tax=Cowpox virus TaxID=10243 RepID=A0A212PPH1_COWPX|nr:CPXV013 protein [Cowpox virus]
MIIYLIGGTSEPHSDTDTDSARFTDPDCGYYDYNNRYYNPTIERRSPEDGKESFKDDNARSRYLFSHINRR